MNDDFVCVSFVYVGWYIFNDFLYVVIIVPSLLLQAEVRQAVCAMYKQPIEQTQVKEEREVKTQV